MKKQEHDDLKERKLYCEKLLRVTKSEPVRVAIRRDLNKIENMIAYREQIGKFKQ